MWVEFVSALTLLWGFFSKFSGFPPPKKINISKFQLNQDRVWKPTKADVASSLNIVILFIIY